MESNRLVISILCAIALAAGVVIFLPMTWFMPIFVGSIVATLLFALVARLSVKDGSPVNPIVDLAATVLSVPSRPLGKVSFSWALCYFFIFAAFVISLALSVVVRANA
jgi:hypothetical protein